MVDLLNINTQKVELQRDLKNKQSKFNSKKQLKASSDEVFNCLINKPKLIESSNKATNYPKTKTKSSKRKASVNFVNDMNEEVLSNFDKSDYELKSFLMNEKYKSISDISKINKNSTSNLDFELHLHKNKYETPKRVKFSVNELKARQTNNDVTKQKLIGSINPNENGYFAKYSSDNVMMLNNRQKSIIFEEDENDIALKPGN